MSGHDVESNGMATSASALCVAAGLPTSKIKCHCTDRTALLYVPLPRMWLPACCSVMMASTVKCVQKCTLIFRFLYFSGCKMRSADISAMLGFLNEPEIASSAKHLAKLFARFGSCKGRMSPSSQPNRHFKF